MTKTNEDTNSVQPMHVDMPSHIQAVYDRSTCIHGRTEIEAALDQMAMEICNELESSNPLFLSVLIGGIIPMGNLLPRLHFPLELDYVHATRYQGETRGSDLKWIAKPTHNLKDRTIVIVDDILDGGITLAEIIKYCEEQGAKKVYTAVLVDKKCARMEGGVKTADFIGLSVDNDYVFGYGLDYKNYLRNVPGIYKVAPEDQ